MAKLMAKLRINYSFLKMLPDVTSPPKENSIQGHARLIEPFMEGNNSECFVSHSEFEKMKAKTYLHLRLRELLREHSPKASLIVMSLPMPNVSD
jgi:solute carrier family 12 (sodium/potassium/chloride transporter), member 2